MVCPKGVPDIFNSLLSMHTRGKGNVILSIFGDPPRPVRDACAAHLMRTRCARALSSPSEVMVSAKLGLTLALIKPDLFIRQYAAKVSLQQLPESNGTLSPQRCFHTPLSWRVSQIKPLAKTMGCVPLAKTIGCA